MTTFGIEIEEGFYSVKKFVKETNERLSKVHLLDNPFNSDSKLFYFKNTIAANIKPIYLNFPLYAAFIIIPIMLMIHGWIWSGWHIPGLIFICLSFFWSKQFFYLMLRIGLKHAKYKGRIKLISQQELIRRLITNGTNRSFSMAKK